MKRVYKAGTDVLISGYWDKDPGDKYGKDREQEPYNDRVCSTSIACVYPAGVYPHIGMEQRFWIEDPPHWGGDEVAKKWTTDFFKWYREPWEWQYFPMTLMHEFGHTFARPVPSGEQSGLEGRHGWQAAGD